MRLSWQSGLLLAAALATAGGQEQPIRVTSTLVQVDAVVTTPDGRLVPDLTVDDFELFEDGKAREIKTFSFVQMAARRADGVTQAAAGRPNAGARREDVRRTMAMVVDDLRMSIESAHSTREALRKFVAEQMETGDLVAILTTSGIGPLGQFTTDRNLLRAAIERVRVNLTRGAQAGGLQAIGAGVDGASLANNLADRRFAVGTLGGIRHIAEGMRPLPGRKSIVLFSESMRMAKDFLKDEPPVDVNDVRRVTDGANRAAVVIYSVDPRGLVYPGLQAKDDTQGLEQEEIGDALAERMKLLRGTQATLQFMAGETGGFASMNGNDLNAGLRRILNDQAGYYLLGFALDEEAATRARKDGKYHRLQVRLKKPGLRVRYRTGYIARETTEAGPAKSAAERLMSALTSPFASTEMPLRFSPVFSLGEKNQLIVRARLHVGAGEVTFGPADAQGIVAGTLHLVAVTDGESRAMTQKSHTIRLPAEALPRVMQGGFVFALEHEVKKPGAYQMRVAILDALSGKTGSASRFIEVPDVSHGRMAMSGISLAVGDWRQQDTQQENASLAARAFQRNQVFSYGVTVYNAPDPAKLELQPRLVVGDQTVWEGRRFPVVQPVGTDRRRIPAGGILRLGEKSAPGEYLLELRMWEGARPIASQWIDFELN